MTLASQTIRMRNVRRGFSFRGTVAALIASVVLAVAVPRAALGETNPAALADGRLANTITQMDPDALDADSLARQAFVAQHVDYLIENRHMSLEEAMKADTVSKQEQATSHTTHITIGELGETVTDEQIDDLALVLSQAEQDRVQGEKHNVVVTLLPNISGDQHDTILTLLESHMAYAVVVDQRNGWNVGMVINLDEHNQHALELAKQNGVVDYKALEDIANRSGDTMSLRLVTRIPDSFHTPQSLVAFLTIYANMGHGWQSIKAGMLETITEAASLIKLMA